MGLSEMGHNKYPSLTSSDGTDTGLTGVSYGSHLPPLGFPGVALGIVTLPWTVCTFYLLIYCLNHRSDLEGS